MTLRDALAVAPEVEGKPLAFMREREGVVWYGRPRDNGKILLTRMNVSTDTGQSFEIDPGDVTMWGDRWEPANVEPVTEVLGP